jgi:ketosteroid isomerase-like protein
VSIDSGILAERLVRAFGDPDAIGELLTPDAEWWITPTVGVLGSPSIGRETIVAAMRVIFGDFWSGEEVTVHHAIGVDDIGAVRFTLRAKARYADNQPYKNEYAVWVRRVDDHIDRVWEYLDVAWTREQLLI